MAPVSIGRVRRLGGALFVAIAWLGTAQPAAASSALELVRMARAHETVHEEGLAVRRYMEALALDATCEEAYLGLGSLRARRGDLHEADRVYSLALERRPELRAARTARAYVRRARGMHDEAIADLLGGDDNDPAALRILAGWHAEDGQVPAQLAVWRRLAARAEATQDAALLREARLRVRALVMLVGPADPAARPVEPEPFRRFLAILAKRGG